MALLGLHLPPLDQLIVLMFAGLLVAAALKDAQSFTIPNRYCAAIALLYPAYLIGTGMPEAINWMAAVALSSAVLLVGFALYAGHFVGGGDVKLVAAVTLWAGLEHLLDFLIITGLAGGCMVLFYWAHHRLSKAATPGLFFQVEMDPNFVKRPVPYAIPIATGGLYVAFTLSGLV